MVQRGSEHKGTSQGQQTYDRLFYSERKLWDRCEDARPILRRLERIRENGIEAAREIGRLRAALQAIADHTPDDSAPGGWKHWATIAEEALGSSSSVGEAPKGNEG
jgi:predicted dienelactone hydrolase